MSHRLIFAVASALLLVLQGCFTGVESTPRITYSDVKKEHVVVTPEQQMLADVQPEPPASWRQGKRFYVTDPKISLIFLGEPAAARTLAGSDIVYQRMRPVMTVTGDTVMDVVFTAPAGDTLVYRTTVLPSKMAERTVLDVPFTVERSMVDNASGKLVGNTYYVVTPLWYDAAGSASVAGLRHVPIKVTAVEPGNSTFPMRVEFVPDGSSDRYSLYMSVGDQRTATRNFHTLFAFDDPRRKYPRINDQTWDMIIHSQVKVGMSRDECRLALGSPRTIGQRPTSAGMVEYWSYDDGVYLLFDEGYLSQFRK